MRKITTLEDRHRLLQMVDQGRSCADIAKALSLAVSTVKKWRRRARQGRLHSCMGRPARGILSTFDAALVQQVDAWRAAHPGWGATTVRLELLRDPRFDPAALPSRASIARYLHQHAAPRSYERHGGLAQTTAESPCCHR